MAFKSWFWVRQIMLLTSFLLTDVHISFIGCSAYATSTHRNSNFLKSFSGRGSEYFTHAGYAVPHPARLTEVGRRNLASSHRDSSRREVEALIAFKKSVTGDPLDSLDSWHANATSACGWKWVRCSSSSDNVVRLDLGSLGLVGSVPQFLGDLNLLEYLDLSSNVLTGSIPDSIANSSNLSYLNVSHNQVTGRLPSSLGQLYSLQFFDSSSNNLSGEIPAQLGDLFNLQYLDLSTNKLAGEIPGALGNCSLLTHLDLSSNTLKGGIPLVLSKLANLQVLALGYNSLVGAIPNELGNCTSLITFEVAHNFGLGGELPQALSGLQSLQWLSVENCNLGGDFPKWVINITFLQYLSLGSNGFSGQIPEEIGRLSEYLSYLDVMENNLTGPIPKSIINCTALYFFQGGGNHLSGNIPAEVGFLTNLEVFNLIENDLSGVLPSSFSNCSSLTAFGVGENPTMGRQTIPSWVTSLAHLETLSLAGMNLYGEIPAHFGQLSKLSLLALYGNNLGGVVPTSMQNLTSLGVLDIDGNAFQGELPSDIFGNMSNLYFVQLAANLFVGLPSLSKFGNRDSLEIVDISSNLLSGELDWGHAHGGVGSALQVFYAFDNNISGPIPEGFSNCSYLTYLDLHNNKFSGPIPSSLGNLTNLGFVYLDHNDLQGGIPRELMNCVELVIFSVGVNKLEGSIPWAVGQLVYIEYFDVSLNFFAGTLPSSFANLTQMVNLYLDYNKFEGTIPVATLSKWSDSIADVDLSHNFFSGSLPPEFGKLTNLQNLDVSVNHLSGSIPNSLAACTGLRYLDVSLNNFSGTLPANLDSLQHLQFFNASFNHFEGALPATGFFQSLNLTRDSFLGNPELCGSTNLVSQECSGPLIQPQRSCKGFHCGHIWIPVASSIIVIFLLGGSYGWWIVGHHKKEGNNDMIVNFGIQGRVALNEREMMEIINGGEDNVIGKGAKSIVYRGALPSGEMFALKVFQADCDNDAVAQKNETDGFLKELQTLAMLRHVNIMKILGLCVTTRVRALILEYVSEGSLHDHLYGDSEACHLSFGERFKIISGVAHALVYLHESFHDPIIHRDLKPGNIMLGKDLLPKVGDFGISKVATSSSNEEDRVASASSLCGTVGYIPPEYATQSRVSTKGDVYSYGVILLEILTRRKPTVEDNLGSCCSLVVYVLEYFKEAPFQLLDPTLKEEGMANSMAKDQMLLVLRIGLLCTRPTPKSRPAMKDVVEMLNQIKNIACETPTLRSIEDLANEISGWCAPDSADEVVSINSS